MPIGTFLDSYVFNNSNGLMGKFVLDMGRYNRFEEYAMFNMTTTMMAFQMGLRDKVMVHGIFDKLLSGLTAFMKDIAPEMISDVMNRISNRKSYDYDGLMDYLERNERILEALSLQIPDSSLVKDEYRNAIRLIRLGAGLKQYIGEREILGVQGELERLQQMDKLCTDYLSENKRLWLQRNKPGGYDLSIGTLVSLQDQIAQRIQLLQKPALARNWNRFLEKLTTSAAILYFKMT
jgi:hypothetical protein